MNPCRSGFELTLYSGCGTWDVARCATQPQRVSLRVCYDASPASVPTDSYVYLWAYFAAPGVEGGYGSARRQPATDGITLQGLESCRCAQPLDMHREQQGPFRELNLGPRAP